MILQHGREPSATATFNPIAFEAGTNPRRLASGSLPHACTKLWQKRPPSQPIFWQQARRHNLRGARENVQKITRGGRSPHKHSQPQQSMAELQQIHTDWPQVSTRKRLSVCSQADHPTKKIAGWKTGSKMSSRNVKVACV
ncbi:hypothetical protein O181_095478 [Austropuccinia psidii MF-1]|uniref:Uncharacterized protein n=1 Tax=Austropuccinia psidii MF-1 TaxID=1389203 RepID=A0A9Q3J554_9BASI|nr:hypothetical protein [Austropuccinia psidii MF-1]